eukprot:gene28811-32000_t
MSQIMHMSSPIEALEGVGKVTMAVFHKAGLKTIGDLYGKTCGQGLEEALQQMREACLVFKDDRAYWKGLATRIQTVISRVCSEEARPYEPDHFICPITLQLIKDPVMSKYGDTYEREAIEELVTSRHIDMYHRSLEITELFPNRNLKDAIEYYKAHELRFAIPVREMLQRS